MSALRYLRLTGFCLGATLGCTYGLVSQASNRLALPGLPLYQPPLGFAGNVLLGAVAGGVLGLAVAWTESTAIGIFAGSALGALAIVGSGMMSLGAGPGQAAGTVIAGIFLYVPLAWAFVPLVAVLRWAVNRQVGARRAPLLTWGRLRLPLALVIVVGIVAAFSLYDADARTVLRRMDGMMGEAVAARSAADLPAALRSADVRGLGQGARGAYTLEWTENDLDRFIELRPAFNYDYHSAVIARFASGWVLVCLYPTAEAEPRCKTY